MPRPTWVGDTGKGILPAGRKEFNTTIRERFLTTAGNFQGDTTMAIECEMSVFAATGPFDDELLTGDHDAALARIQSMTPVEAVQLVPATYCRADSVIDRNDLDSFAEIYKKRAVPVSSIPDGEYAGTWSGYTLKFEAHGDSFEATTTDGIRGTAACTIVIDGTSATVKTEH